MRIRVKITVQNEAREHFQLVRIPGIPGISFHRYDRFWVWQSHSLSEVH